jgi:hypothetical protein
MKFLSSVFVLFIALGLTCLAQNKSDAQKPLKRETAYPDGKQTSFGATMGVGWTNGFRTEQYTFTAPYDAVWEAVKNVANEFANIGKRPLNLDAERRMAINSNLKYTRERNTSMIPMTWVDEVITEVTYIDKLHSKVTVKRKVLQLTTDQDGRPAWGLAGSNGKLERWILTLIDVELSSNRK